MTQDDPFGGDLNRPAPPASPPGRPIGSPWQVSSGDYAHHAEEPDLDLLGGLNPILATANPLLNIIAQLRSGKSHPKPDPLRAGLVAAFADFETRARRASIPERSIVAARYILGTAIDEAAALGCEGGHRAWYQRGLLAELELDTVGGETIFQLLGKLAQNPKGERDLLEFIWVVLSQGFEGRYATIENGQSKLASVREKLFQLLQKDRPPFERDLAPHWRVTPIKRNPLLGWLPLWVTGAVAATALLLIYIGFLVALNGASDPVYAAIQALRQPTTIVAKAQPTATPRLAKLLTRQIEAKQLTVLDEAYRSTVTIQGDQFFAPGSAEISAEVKPLLNEIAQALSQIPGHIIVTGHTDDQPIRSRRYPSNWELSKARAEAVVDLLAQTIGRNRLEAKGEAEHQPLVPNTSPQNRAINRRVEIALIVAKLES